uniref:Uncharacterized protein n=1 Tax=Panagrolaimus sp. ES5 TaxID=591445 RepID=A0AC34FLK3_9BILA
MNTEAKRISLKVILLGDDAVGKSTLFFQYIYNKIPDVVHATIGTCVEKKNLDVYNKPVTLQIWDTPGLNSFRPLIGPFCRGQHCCVLIYDVSYEKAWMPTIESLDMWLKLFQDNENSVSATTNASIVLIGNKIDIAESNNISKKEIKSWCSKNNIASYFEVSAKDGTNVEETFEEIAKFAFQYYMQKNQDFVYPIYYFNIIQNMKESMFVNYKIKSSEGLFKLENKQYSFPKFNYVNNVNAVGIDLGTTRCCAAVNRKNGIEIIALENTGGRLLPSYVAFDEAHEKCGEIVISRMQYYSRSTVFDAKRIIGKLFNEIEADVSWQFTIAQFFDRAQIGLISCDGETFKFPEEISAVLLKHIKMECEKIQGRELNETVITIPAMFDETQKEATYVAALLAGWEKIHLLPEPVAAAFAYFNDKPIPKNSKLLLFDLGGGTLDICVFRINKNKLEIMGRSGDPYLGGRDFDNILINYFREQLLSEYCVTVGENKKYKLLKECQEIKHNLSLRDEDQ